jgi:O-antigen biosynthesis protein
LKLTIFTPLSEAGNPYIREAYRSLCDQRDPPPWEWVLVPNHGGVVPPDLPATDPRVRVCPAPEGLEGIGALKRYAVMCAAEDSDAVVEFDHDDLLAPQALRRISEAFFDGADFVYSDFCEFNSDYSSNLYGADFGWTYEPRPVSQKIDGALRTGLVAMVAPAISRARPHALRRILWAPNHVRAWRRSFYVKLGGHRGDLPVADDFDLVLRTVFEAGSRVTHIPECLYFYRLHDAQTVKVQNGEIQDIAEVLYCANAEPIALMFARENGLKAIDLCGAHNGREGFEVADLALTGTDLNKRWPWADNSVGVFRAADALEHLKDPMHVMAEAYRCLAPGGFFQTLTPSTDGRGAWCDPTHITGYNELSFRYYTEAEAQKYIAHRWEKKGTTPPRFATSRLRTLFPSKWHERAGVVYVEWHGIALKAGYHHYGECEPAWRWRNPHGITKPGLITGAVGVQGS